MTLKHRLSRALLLAVFVAAALGRASLGADDAASVLFAPAFQIALIPAALAGFLAASRFGVAGARGLLDAAAATLLVAVLAALVVAAFAPVAGLPITGLLDMIAATVKSPMALAALAAGYGAAQIVAFRQSRKNRDSLI
jgi:hypothetical protein